ncbi:S-layer homology domain-containing protein [Bacillus tuaregi]|uniref:S-layer homology domain-containing protein n=1 Tax=Bacillus tuaregi TaxID=1816695 RepID=UPI0008F8867F|nr:S-layer homology domain-containing protein [Bacillus tuaregi]
MEKHKKRSISRTIFLALFAAVLIFTQAMAASAATFSDVPESSDYYEVVEEIASKGYVKGFDDGDFHPEVLLDRVQGALIFSRILHTDTSNLTKQYFTDVPKEYRFYKEVSSIARDGVINGYTDGTFGLYDSLTRGQVAILIYNAFDEFKDFETDNGPFTDVDGTIYEEAVTALYNAEVTKGTSSTTFSPHKTIKRGDFLLLLSAALKAVNGEKEIANVKVNVNENQTATVSGKIKDFKLNGKELVNIKIEQGDNQLVNVDVEPTASHNFSYTTSVLEVGDYTAKVSIVGSEKVKSVDFTVTDMIAPAAPGISFVGKSVVGDVVDLLDLKSDLTVRYTFTTEDARGAKVGDTLKYTVTSDSGKIEESVILTQQDINRGYVEDVIKTNALRNLLGGLLGGTVGDLTGGLLGGTVGGILGASTNVSAAAADDTIIVESPSGEEIVTSAGLLDGLLGGLLGNDGLLGGSGDGGVLDTNGLLGLPVNGLLNGVVEIVDGVLVTVVDGVIVGVVDGLLDGVVGGLVSGSEEVTIEAQLIDAAEHKSEITKEVYKFQVSDVVGIL